MKPIRILTFLATGLLAAGLLAACGGDGKEDYAQEVDEVLEPLGEELTTLGETIGQSKDAAALAAGIGEAQDKLNQAAADLEAIDPPSDVEDINADLVAAVSGFADDLGAAREAAESDDPAALQAAIAELPAQAQEFGTELTDIRERAIDAGVPIPEADGSGE